MKITDTDKAYCYYNNDAGGEAATYGALYTYAAAKDACPTGWHLPSDAEWTTLTDYLGGTNVAGGKMKEIGTTHWNSPNTGADNNSGFSALPGGYHDGRNGTFYGLGSLGVWWSRTDYGGAGAYSRSLDCSVAEAYRYYYNKSYGFSVRCVRD